MWKYRHNTIWWICDASSSEDMCTHFVYFRRIAHFTASKSIIFIFRLKSGCVEQLANLLHFTEQYSHVIVTENSQNGAASFVCILLNFFIKQFSWLCLIIKYGILLIECECSFLCSSRMWILHKCTSLLKFK